MNMLFRTILGVSGFLLASVSAQGAPIAIPNDLNPGDTYRIGFLTYYAAEDTSADINYYNQFVTDAANASLLASFGTTWTAFVSTATVNARDNTNTNPLVDTGAPIYTVRLFQPGPFPRLVERVASDNLDLWDGQGAQFYTEHPLSYATTHQNTLTGTDKYGFGVPGFTLGQPLGGFVTVGRAYSGNEWMQSTAGPAGVGGGGSLWAISGFLTVPGAIPEPTTLALFGLGLAGLGFAARRRVQRTG